MSNPPALTNTEIARLSALRDEVRAGGRSEGEVTDPRERAWLRFWQSRAACGDDVFAGVDRQSEWTAGLVDVEFGTITDERTGVEYVSVTLRECVTAFGLTRCQALRNLDKGAREYVAKLESVPRSQHNEHQLVRMRRYLRTRETCPCDLTPCQCVDDDPARIAH